MFAEIEVRRDESGMGRRWFTSDGFELVVWCDGEAPYGFQLCYRFGACEYALTYTPVGGYAHDRIDDGEASVLANRTPVLRPDAGPGLAHVRREFMARAVFLPPEIRMFVERGLGHAG